MSSDLIIRISDQIGLKLARCDNDELVAQNGSVYITHTKLRSLMEAQAKYGTGRVHYSPNPILMLEPDTPVERKDVILIITSKLTDVVERAIKNVFNYSITIVDEYQLTHVKMLTLFRNVKLVIADQTTNPDIFLFLIGAAVPFLALDSELGSARLVLKGMALSRLILDQNVPDPERLERRLDSLERHYDYITNILTKNLTKYRRIMSIVSRAQGFRDIHYNNVIFPHIPNENMIALAVSPGDYSHNSGLESLARDFSSYQVRGGVHMELSIFDTFLTFKSIYLHPWIGLIDSVDLDDYKNLVENQEFRNSLSMCLGLIAFSDDIAGFMKASLDAVGHKVLIVTLPIPVTRRVGFNISRWIEDPVLKHQSKKHTLLYLNRQNDSRVVKDENFTEDDPESVIVLTQSSSNIFDMLYYHISRLTPVVLAPSESAKLLLGENYPLFTENLKPYQLREFVTTERVNQTMIYLMEQNWLNMETFMHHLTRSKIGGLLRDITTTFSQSPVPFSSSSSS